MKIEDLEEKIIKEKIVSIDVIPGTPSFKNPDNFAIDYKKQCIIQEKNDSVLIVPFSRVISILILDKEKKDVCPD